MTTPTVTELPSRREPVTADTFVGDLAIGERRLYGDVQLALTALGLRALALGGRPELPGSAGNLVQEDCD